VQNPIKQIHKFNLDAGLITKGYDDFLESSFQIEEALEDFNLAELAHAVGSESTSAKDVSRAILDLAPGELTDVQRLDKACDALIFSVGSMAKLGLNPNQITKAVNLVMQANNQKLVNKKFDSLGKLIKDPSFIGPEAKLQLILDERT
jgi:predicted HAD superfamily Cof-like phosphohydrolase